MHSASRNGNHCPEFFLSITPSFSLSLSLLFVVFTFHSGCGGTHVCFILNLELIKVTVGQP